MTVFLAIIRDTQAVYGRRVFMTEDAAWRALRAGSWIASARIREHFDVIPVLVEE